MARTTDGRRVDVTGYLKKCVEEDRDVLMAIAKLDDPQIKVPRKP
jgi:hypothetical protein